MQSLPAARSGCRPAPFLSLHGDMSPKIVWVNNGAGFDGPYVVDVKPRTPAPQLRRNGRLNLQRLRLLVAQECRCFLCGHRMRTIPTREHVVAKSKGGRGSTNFVLSHETCN